MICARRRAARLTGLRSVWNYDEAIVVGMQERAGREGDSAEFERHSRGSSSFLAGGPGIGPQRLDTKAEQVESGGVADAAVDDHARPAVIQREPGDVVAQKCAAIRPAAIDNEHLPRAGPRQALANQDIVLIAANRRDPPGEDGRAERPERHQADRRSVAIFIEDVCCRCHAANLSGQTAGPQEFAR